MFKLVLRGSQCILALGALGLQGCGDRPDSTEPKQSALVGGTVSPTLLPNVGSGSASDALGGYSCTGTLIAGQWVLTAGHCTAFQNSINNPSFTMSFFGSTSSAIFNMAPQLLPIDTNLDDLAHWARGAVGYPAPNGNSDIALLMLPKPIRDPKFGIVTSVVALATSMPPVGTLVDTWGFGHTATSVNQGKNVVYWPYVAPVIGAYLTEDIIVPGDSGGPSFMSPFTSQVPGAPTVAIGETGLWGINSGSTIGANGLSAGTFGDVVYYRPQLCNLMYNKPHRFCQTGSPLGGEPSGCGPYVSGSNTNVVTFVLNETSNGGGAPFQHCGTTSWDATCVTEAEKWADPWDVRSCQTPKGGVVPDGVSDITLVGNFIDSAHTSFIPQAWSDGHGTFTGAAAYTDDISGAGQTSGFSTWAVQNGVKALAGDFDGDGVTDIALTGGLGWSSLPVAFNLPRQGGYYHVTNSAITAGSSYFSPSSCSGSGFATWATCAGAIPIAGDFDGDGRTDIALIGSPAFVGTGGAQSGAYPGSIPIAFSNGNGTFRVTNTSSGAPINNSNVSGGAGYFELFAANSTSGVGWRSVVGDFDGDGRSDIALVGGSSNGQFLSYIPIAFSNGDGSFRFGKATQTATSALNFYAAAGQANVTPVAGDFNGDGFSDIALTGAAGWSSIPVALSNGDGSTFTITNNPVQNFPTYAAQPGAKPVAGDFNGDGLADIALTGGTGWYTIPVAFSVAPGNGQFMVTNSPTNTSRENFPFLAGSAGTPRGGAY